MMIFHCSYIRRTGEICGGNSKSEKCYIHRKSPVYTPCRDCGESNRSKYNACNDHVGKYKSRENYNRKKQDELHAKIDVLKNCIPELPGSGYEL